MTLCEQLRSRLRGRVAVVGIGNPARGDDAAGSFVARRLCSQTDAIVLDAQEIPENFLGHVVEAKPETIVFVDAMDLGAEPGTLALVEKDQMSQYCASTHRVPLRVLAEFLYSETRADIFIIAIQPNQMQLGSPMSEQVVQCALSVVEILRDALALSSESRPCRGCECELVGEVNP
ncbi:MAG: hydrogenase 3 maturation endopeptidase HyCI [Pseudomonadota bacterium]